MVPVVTILIILAALLIVAVIRHTNGKDYTPSSPHIPDEALTLQQAQSLYSDGELTTRAGYLHYNLSKVYEVPDKDLGAFVGYVKPDAQHDGTLFIYDSDDRLRGRITDQRDYYATLLSRRRTNCYGFVTKSPDSSYYGEVCLRKI